MLSELYIIKGKDAGKFFKLGHEPFVFLGRSITNQIPIDDREVSRVHCRLEVTANGCSLRDLSSGNGTFVNEERASEQALNDGDIIRLGKTVLTVLLQSKEEREDWAQFVGAGNGSEDRLSSVSSGEIAIAGSPRGELEPTAGSLADTALSVPAVSKKNDDNDDDLPAPFSTEEERELEASEPRGRKNRVSLRNLIPGYLIERKMSGSRSSTQAIIYKAFQKSLERAVAIKTLLARGEGRQKAARRFLREVSRVARLPHPNIVVIHDAGRVKNFYYFVMEYLAGGSILDSVADQKPLPLVRGLRIAHEISRALGYIHNHGVIHRGVNPGCILIDSATGASKLCGFGFAKEEEVSPSDTTYFSSPVEGFAFLAPEQVLGKDAGPQTDIYSLGATLWAMLAGSMPFSGRTHIEVSSDILEGRIAPLSEVNDDIPKAVAAIVERCLAPEAEDRFEDAEELTRALGRVLLKLEDRSAASVKGLISHED